MEKWNWLFTVNYSPSLSSRPPLTPSHVVRDGRDWISGASEKEAEHNVSPGLEPGVKASAAFPYEPQKAWVSNLWTESTQTRTDQSYNWSEGT